MHKDFYDDYKYVLQDTSQIFLGGKYTFQELLDNENVPFKLRMILERYLLHEVDFGTTLESHFYFLKEGEFIVKAYKQLKVKIKFNMIEERKNLLGKKVRQYTTEIFPVDQFVKMPAEEKEKLGVVIQEILISKLAMMSF